MKHQDMGRRKFLRNSASALAAASLPVQFASAAVPTHRRPEWQTFKTTPHYATLLSAISTMKANANPADPSSWTYWANIHLASCPHSVPYFLSWHRGFLYQFEARLRIVSGDSSLVVPYWDYYTDPRMPAEFTNPSGSNPLYANRVNTSVYPALSMAPFSPSIINFQRGLSQAYEPAIENAPHNPVHNIIGGIMAAMDSPVDPIFWLHHANIDRLWVAWVKARGGRTMPWPYGPYWSGTISYTSTLAMQRIRTYDTHTSLDYYYQNERFPAGLPAVAQKGRILRVRSATNIDASPPPVGNFRLAAPRPVGEGRFAVGGSLKVGLDKRSVSAQLPVSAEYGQAIAQIARKIPSPVPGASALFKSVRIVLDDIQMTADGAQGGYFYNIYLNRPRTRDGASPSGAVLIGNLGPFQVAGAAHHHGGPARLGFVVTHMVKDLSVLQIGMLTLSFVRVDGENSPAGPAMEIGEARMELGTDDVGS